MASSFEPLACGCLCGAVRFELSAPPLAAGYCHCTRCQRRTGSAAAASARIAPGSMTFRHGLEHVRAWRAAQDGFEKCFCEICGAHLFSRNPDAPDQVAIRMGAFDCDPGVRPAWHAFVADAAPWEPIADDGLPRYEGRKAY